MKPFLVLALLVACSSTRDHADGTTGQDTRVLSRVPSVGDNHSRARYPPADASCFDSSPEAEIPEEADAETFEDAETAEEARQPTLAEVFLEIGGVATCSAAYYALSPEKSSDGCHLVEDPDRRAKCLRRRAPVRRWVDRFCEAALEESKRWDLDPLMFPALAERESDGGRLTYDRETKVYEISQEVCRLSISQAGLVGGPPWPAGRRDSVVVSFRNAAGEVRDREVFILEEDEDSLVVDTCIYGVRGVLQLMPGEFERGLLVAATGLRLRGTYAEREARVLSDVTLHVQLAAQAMVRHRDACGAEGRPWREWIGAWASGNCDGGKGYTRQVAEIYVRACRDAYLGDLLPIEEFWGECHVVETWLEGEEP